MVLFRFAEQVTKQANSPPVGQTSTSSQARLLAGPAFL